MIHLYWRIKGYMERVVLPGGEEIEFDHDKGYIDYSALREYPNTPCTLYEEGTKQEEFILDSVSLGEDGYLQLNLLTSLETETADG